MEFRAPTIASQQNARAIKYLTKNLSDQEAGHRRVETLIEELGNSIDVFPDWHPVRTAPMVGSGERAYGLSDIKAYSGMDHTIEFVRGFVTCPYSDKRADQIVTAVKPIQGLHAYRLGGPLYADNACPVVVEALEVSLEADGTIRSKDALRWFVKLLAQEAESSQVAETWWNTRVNILGSPHGSRSSLFVNQHAGVHMRKILETMNASGMFGPIKESSLDMLSPKKRAAINENLIRTAVKVWDKKAKTFEFEMRGEVCKAEVRDTWDDGTELSVRVVIGEYDLFVSGFYENDSLTYQDPKGKRTLAEKFT
jgi:hypothetical protein